MEDTKNLGMRILDEREKAYAFLEAVIVRTPRDDRCDLRVLGST